MILYGFIFSPRPPDSCLIPAGSVAFGAMDALLRGFILLAGLLAAASWDRAALAGTSPEPRSGGPVQREGPTEASLEEEFRRAREALRASPGFKGQDAESHFRLAETLHHRGDMNGATDEYRAAIRLNPDFAEAYRGLGALLLDRHDYAGAAGALRTATGLRPNDAEAFYWLGRSLMALRDWPGATAALRTATRLKPDDAEAHADLGLVRMVQGDASGAEDALRQAVRLKPDNADAHHRLEIVQAHRHDPEFIARSASRILDTMFARE